MGICGGETVFDKGASEVKGIENGGSWHMMLVVVHSVTHHVSKYFIRKFGEFEMFTTFCFLSFLIIFLLQSVYDVDTIKYFTCTQKLPQIIS